MHHKIISLQYLENMAMGDHKFMVEMIDLFLSHANETPMKLELAIEANDNKNFIEIIHKLKSSLNLFQVTSAVEMISEMEARQVNSIPKIDLELLRNKIVEILKIVSLELIKERELIIKKAKNI